MIYEKLKKLNLRTRIVLLLAVVIFLIITAMSIIFVRRYQEYEFNLLRQERIKNLKSLDASLDGIIMNADNYSKIMIADDTVQLQMSTGDLYASTLGQQKVINKARSILQFSEGIDAIWLIDGRGQRLQIGNSINVYADDDGNYNYLKKPYGSAEMLIEKGEDSSYLSLVRAYNSTNSFKTIGIIGVDISGKYIEELIAKTMDLDKEKLLIMNTNEEIVFWNDARGVDPQYLAAIREQRFEDGIFVDRVRIKGDNTLVSGIFSKGHGWKIYRFTPLPVEESTAGIKSLVLELIIIIGTLIFIFASMTAGMLAKPIQTMLKAMQDTEDGIPSKIKEEVQLNEFQILFSGYNQMVDRIKQLIDETIRRQQRIRQVELNEIQEQMKPHFLYNTLDSIEALAMIGDTETVCKLIEALGDFYRKSVSGGREFLTIKEEIKMVQDYSEIMRIRFGETFHCVIHCDESCHEYLIPKLTIQPLVENAFQHGIRGQIGYGMIEVTVSDEPARIHICVKDNGVGIPKEIIEELSNATEAGEKGSLGLRGTIKRLTLMYGSDFSYCIGQTGPSEIDLYINKDALKR